MDKNYKISVEENVAGLGLVNGFEVAGVSCDIRATGDYSRLDTAVIISKTPAAAAGVFTTNDVKAAPVLTDIAHLSASQKMRAIVANSGIANACTGERGMKDAKQTAKILAECIGANPEQVLVCSTGRIGEFLPMEKIEKGIKQAVAVASNDDASSKAAASAILTTDTRPKTVLARVEVGGRTFSVAGMAKGAGMIEPNMATMLAFIVSDADVPQNVLKESLVYAANRSFNRMSVDGDMSTNDTVLCLCNGASGVDAGVDDADAFLAFREAVLEVSRALARMIVGDGEKISRVIEVKTVNARDEAQAEKICRAIANSMLVKSAWFGGDPNWGRILDAAGYARTGLVLDKTDLYYDKIPVLKSGQPVMENRDLWKEAVSKKCFTVTVDLNLGSSSEAILTTDLTPEYVIFNKGE